MTRHIACLHTAASNVPLFDAACPPGVTLHHTLRADLLAEAEAAGGLTPAIAARTAAAIEALAAPGIDAVLLTCSTLGPSLAQARATIPLRRADAALAEAARRAGGRLVVLCAVETTLGPTGALFGPGCEIRLVPGAWAAFRAGDAAGYARMVAEAADAAFAEGADCVALAQASMAPAAALCRRGTPLTSPAASLAALA
ncbi:hypothetical protein [Falsiroseomonas tokyonensis]|uniref:Asp/Glu racemase n=1 Tax=Falsiroseomonas tokyonensis TaxID=430521 RepID=A0ABV7BT53_9PROT|nr:hypothetical protein [Falsiroseomonas tokyonensis]MBU8538823.1 hypothetical protein [Falsiroseomonas tokyonensis]